MSPSQISDYERHYRRDLIDPYVLAKLSRLPVRSRGVVEGSYSGMHRSPHRGASVEFAEYRKYVPNDDIKNVDWKVYAKSDRFYVKEFEADTNLRCHLIVDCSGSMGYAGENGSKYHYATSMAATLAQLLIQQGDAVGLQCFNDTLTHDIPARGSAKHLRSIFEVLSQIKPSGKTEIVRELHNLAEKIHRRAVVILFSDLFTDLDPLLDCFQHMRFRKHDLAVFHLIDPSELSFDFDRSIRFVDMESSFSLVTEPSLLRDKYLKEVEKYLHGMKEGCQQYHVDYRLVDMSRTYDDVLTEFLLSRQRHSQ